MINEDKLLIETRKRMQQLYEYSFYNGVMEDGEEADPNAAAAGDPNAMGGDPNAMGGNPNAMGGNPNAMGGDPNAMGSDPNAMGGDPNAMGGDPNAMGGGQPNLAPNAGMPNAAGDPNAMGGDPSMMEQPGPDDDVVDITDLTDQQEETAGQLEDVDEKLTTLLKIVDKFSNALDANDEKINDLKQELIKRTPTEEETMNVRLHAGGNPFDEKPEEFWDKFKDINNHYNITANNEAPQYQIKKGDIDSINDKMVNDDFDNLDDIPRSLHEYFVR